MKNTIVHIGTLVLSLISAVAAPAATVLTFGGPGYVSQGLVYNYTVGATGTASAWSNTSGRDLTFQFLALDGKVAKISFAAAGIDKLSVGDYFGISNYVNTPLFFAPGFSLTNQGKNLLPITNGWFEILEIQLDEEYGHTPKKIAVDFIAYSATGEYTAGSLRWGSNIPVTPIAQIIPEASSSFLLIGALGLIVCRRRRT